VGDDEGGPSAGDLTQASDRWREQVRAAAIAGDADALRLLFAHAQELFGAQASARWAEALSGLDASAQTG
jgi:hypothetical protein